MLSFAGVAEPHQSAAGKTAHQTSTDESPVVSTHIPAQAIKHSKSKKPSLDMAQSSAASKAAGAASPMQSGQAKMAFSAAAQGTTSQSQALNGPISSDCAEVSAGLWAPQLPAAIKACAATEDSPADVRISMLLVAGCHLRLWLSTVKLVSNAISWLWPVNRLQSVSCELLRYFVLDLSMCMLCMSRSCLLSHGRNETDTSCLVKL